MIDKLQEIGKKYPSLAGVDNFRDLGGIRVSGGRVINDGMIFRSGALFNLTEEEKGALDQLGINYVFDLRSADEVEYKPDYVPQGAQLLVMPVIKSRKKMVIKPDSIEKMIPAWCPAWLAKWLFALRFKMLYRKFPFRNAAYAKMFQVMDEGAKFLFHCTAGKDRTGVGSMLILMALGADYERIKTDYLLSNQYRKQFGEDFILQFKDNKHYAKLRNIFEYCNNVHMEYFNKAYNKIIRKYKTVDKFLLQEYNVDKARIDGWLQSYTYLPQ